MARGKVTDLVVTERNEKVIGRAAWWWKEREAKPDAGY